MGNKYQFVITIQMIFVIFSVKESKSSCATLRSNNSEYSLILDDGYVFGNIGEEYITVDKNWNDVTGTWTVGQFCKLDICTEPYGNGQCSSISNGETSSSSIWLSARCVCKKECTCSEVFMKKSVCALAYLKPNGCNKCNAPYTELGTGSQEMFPDIWREKVSSFLVRPGCNFTVFEDEDFYGDSEIISGSSDLKNWRKQPMGSYRCECDENKTLQQPINLESTSNADFVDIPESLDDVITKYADHNLRHDGLNAALLSLIRGRSSKNVYLLMIGSSGAGKSSAINILLNTPNVTITGGDTSTTSEILEFRIPFPIPELNISNSELRIIDTPGLGDTGGLEKDARFLASLDDYLTNHEELKNNIPNLVLIFHRFDDNRYSGEGAMFVKMIQGLDGSIREKITDENFSNVLFVFSHLCSVSKEMQENPAPKLLRFKEVIELYSLFPKPIMTSVIENLGQENELHMRNGNFELPNRELYPQNLFHKFDTITRNCGDKIGNALVTSKTFRQITSSLNISQITYPLVNSNHIKVGKYLKMLSSASFQFNSSEVSNFLMDAYKTMGTSLKAKYPDVLENLLRYLSLKNIKSRQDVPKTSKSILQLLEGIDQENHAIAYLLKNGLELQAPVFDKNTVTGYGYDIRKNLILSASPFQMNEKIKSSNLGFLLPEVIKTTKLVSSLDKPMTTFNIFEKKKNYFENLTSSLFGTELLKVVNSTELFTKLTSELKEGYYVKDLDCLDADGMSINKSCFTVTRLYIIAQFDLEPAITGSNNIRLQLDFANRLENIEPFNENVYQNFEQWSNFFNDFGTHIIKSADVGGRIDITFEISKQDNVESAVKKVIKSLEFCENPLDSVYNFKEDSKEIFAKSAEVYHKLVFRGGNPNYHVSDISKLTLDEAYQLIKNWKRSLKFYPAVFPKDISPICDVIGDYFPVAKQNRIKEKLERALSRLLTATLKYVEPTPDPKILEELERQRREKENEERRQREELKRIQKENEEKLKQLELEIKRKAEEAERLRLAEIEAQRQREQRERELQEQRRKEAEEAELKRQKEEEERLRILKEEEERQKRECLEARRKHWEELRKIRGDHGGRWHHGGHRHHEHHGGHHGHHGHWRRRQHGEGGHGGHHGGGRWRGRGHGNPCGT